jgi:hypothetical protein
MYYIYLGHLYMVDEVFEGSRLREYTIDEKLTIRVPAPPNLSSLEIFVEKYSLCQAVQEINILWQSEKPPPDLNIYHFAHTHSKVTYDWKKVSKNFDELFLLDINKVATDAVMFLDTDVSISCEDLAFALSVWRSANGNRYSSSPTGSVVGLFPRLHREVASPPVSPPAEANPPKDKETVVSGDTYELLGPLSVWWNQAYSLVLPAGSIIHKKFMWHVSTTSEIVVYRCVSTLLWLSWFHQDIIYMIYIILSHNLILTSSCIHTFLSRQRSEANMPKAMVDYITTHPACTRLAYALSVQSKNADAPIWVDVPVNRVRDDEHKMTYFSKVEEPLKDREYANSCVTDLMRILSPRFGPSGHPEIAYAFHKATRASRRWVY